MHSPRWLSVVGAAALFVPLASVLPRNHYPEALQELPPAPASPAPPKQAQQPPDANAPSSSSKSGPHKYSHANDFLIRGTVFTNTGIAFPAVDLRIRRATEKKFRWQTVTNSRGEFAVRVPKGLQYEMVIHAKGFADQTRSFDAKNGLSDENIGVQMQPVAKGKK
jgi:hypothetical protein